MGADFTAKDNRGHYTPSGASAAGWSYCMFQSWPRAPADPNSCCRSKVNYPLHCRRFGPIWPGCWLDRKSPPTHDVGLVLSRRPQRRPHGTISANIDRLNPPGTKLAGSFSIGAHSFEAVDSFKSFHRFQLLSNNISISPTGGTWWWIKPIDRINQGLTQPEGWRLTDS